MIFGMIRSCMAALVLTAAMSAQGTPAPKVRIVFPEGVHSEKPSMTYGSSRMPAKVVIQTGQTQVGRVTGRGRIVGSHTGAHQVRNRNSRNDQNDGDYDQQLNQ